MAKGFHFDVEFEYPMDKVHAALTDPDYWKRRLDHLYERSTVDAGDGSIEVRVSDELDSSSLPSVVAKLAPTRLGLQRIDRWGPVENGQSAGSVTGITHGLPIRIETALVLSSAGDGARLSVDGTAEVKIPVIGGQVEKLLRKTVEDLLRRDRDAVQSFLADGR